ncbi:hypothetical protein [Geoglobus acetivorans]|uniref:hypothetical protein n=1 Tax=Geoglobus acetivorans TaxID=565033 RepID=UPI00064FCA16
MDKPVKISVHVNEDEWMAFKNYVLTKYSYHWKYLGEELSKAIKLYLSQVANAHTQENEHIISSLVLTKNEE